MEIKRLIERGYKGECEDESRRRSTRHLKVYV
jgi:hypothetical protein